MSPVQAAEVVAAVSDRAAIDSGAVLPPDAATGDVPCDAISARHYRHPALAGRVVVRLSPEPLAPAEDLEMSVLGFDAPSTTATVGVARRRALGFPAWALVHDPERARFALGVTREMKRAVRQAATKPGHARDGFHAIADELSRSVPHFLPSFFEEAGRAFIASGNPTYAAGCFARAREAEQVHALTVDEPARDRVFLEFALAGALTGKALSQHAQALSDSGDPPEALARFRELCVRRTLGGMPPWTGMAKDLRRLMKRAGVAPEQEEKRFLGEVLDAPALVHAAADFWSAYGDALCALCAEAPGIRERLLAFVPEPPGDRARFITDWIALLERCGALQWDVGTEAADGAPTLPPGRPAEWLGKVFTACQGYNRRPPDALFGLIRRMATRLKADGQPVILPTMGWGSELDLDLLDLLCEQGVALAAPTRHQKIRIPSWLQALPDSTERGRDPIHVAQHPRFRPLLEKAVGEVIDESAFTVRVRGMRGFAQARRSWVLGRLSAIRDGTLVEARYAMGGLERAASPELFRAFPDVWTALGALELGPALARTLRAGILDELGWPALEAAVEELAPGKEDLQVFGGFPHLVLIAGLRAIVFGPAGRLFEAELALAKGAKVVGAEFVQGQLLVRVETPDHQWTAFWSGKPHESFQVPYMNRWQASERDGAVLPDGALVRGGRALRAGDTRIEDATHFHSDGKAFWRGHFELREFDIQTGVEGRRSLPRFFEDFVADDAKLYFAGLSLLPVPPEWAAATPLGAREGLSGLRARERLGRVEYESVDGRSMSRVEERHGSALKALLQLPAQPRPIGVQPGHGGLEMVMDDGRVLADFKFGARKPEDAPGTPMLLPLLFWHALVPRDPTGSQALRDLSDDTARRLLAACEQDEGPARVTRVLDREAADIRDARLRTGVIGLARLGQRLGVRLEALRQRCNPEQQRKSQDFAFDDALLNPMLAPFAGKGGYHYGLQAPLAGELADVFTLFAAPQTRPASLLGRVAAMLAPGASVDERIEKTPTTALTRWEELVGATGALAFLSVSPVVSETERAALLELLQAWANGPFVGAGRTFRRQVLSLPEKSPYRPGHHEAQGRFIERGAERWFVRDLGRYEAVGIVALQASPSGSFSLLPGAQVVEEERVDDGPWTGELLSRFVAEVRERGAPALDAQVIAELVRRTGISRPEAVLLWAGLPALDRYEHDALGKERRELLGLKQSEAKVAKESLAKLRKSVRRQLLAAAAAGDVASLWSPLGAGPGDEESPVARLAAAWNQLVGRRAAIDAELLVRCNQELPRTLEPARFLGELARCATSPLFNHDGRWRMDERKLVNERPGEGGSFDDDVLAAAAVHLPYLATTLPAGDPLRACLPVVLERVRDRLKNPELLLPLGTHGLEEEAKEARAALLESIGSRPYPAGGDPKDGRDGGLVVARASRWSIGLAFRPALLPPEPSPLESLQNPYGYGAISLVAAARAMGSDGFQRLVDRVRETPVPEGGFEANPLQSTPTLVAAVAKARGLSEDAAVLYLQTLALTGPTTRAVRTWNDWTPARHKAATTALVAAGLVLAAKRARAGREIFLPGGWEELKAPDLPIETWKLPLYGIPRTPAGLQRPLGRILPLRPLHELFEEAWARVERGDGPRYEEVS